MQSTFADTLLNVSITGSLVRLDLGTMIPAKSAEGKSGLRATSTLQVVMPIEGFVRAFGMQEQIIKKLVADGVLKPAATKEAGIAPTQSTTKKRGK
jgi:hypothetical protein